jgi:hypothetical protein
MTPLKQKPLLERCSTRTDSISDGNSTVIRIAKRRRYHEKKIKARSVQKRRSWMRVQLFPPRSGRFPDTRTQRREHSYYTPRSSSKYRAGLSAFRFVGSFSTESNIVTLIGPVHRDANTATIADIRMTAF